MATVTAFSSSSPRPPKSCCYCSDSAANRRVIIFLTKKEMIDHLLSLLVQLGYLAIVFLCPILSALLKTPRLGLALQLDGGRPLCLALGIPADAAIGTWRGQRCHSQAPSSRERSSSHSAMLVLLVVLFAGAATCLEVEPPSITDDHRYISYSVRPSGNQSTIVCNYTLGEGQAVSGVLWQILKEEVSAGTFEWKPNAPATATGLLKDKVNLERDDSDLELTTLTYELSANYSCTVTADDGRTASARDEILIIDTTSRHVYHGTNMNEGKCRLEVDIKYYPVFPQPTVGAGLYSDSLGGFYEEIANWARVVHANGSVGFSCHYEFQVNENTPADAYFTSSLGVTKSDGTYIACQISSVLQERQHFGEPDRQLQHRHVDMLRRALLALRRAGEDPLVPSTSDSD
ncbi:uncharacterized protein LOC134785691 [Penaeus indicus]|uniref:uncharacterized protein LOC134785691 n=1 Tax=Penaeus indicus TaxID=29960 RepID=UPI00300C63C7